MLAEGMKEAPPEMTIANWYSEAQLQEIFLGAYKHAEKTLASEMSCKPAPLGARTPDEAGNLVGDAYCRRGTDV